MLTDGRQLPGSRFIGGIYYSRLGAQVPRLTRGQLAHACNQHILSGVDIAIMDSTALRARPVTDIKPKFVQLVQALAASLARRQPSVHDNQGPAVPFGLVLKLPTELSPARIRDRAGKPGVLKHVRDLEVFDTNNLMFTHKPRGDRVQCVASLVGDFAMGAGNTKPLLLPPLAVLLPARKASLLLTKIAQTASEFAWVLDLLSAAQDRQVRQPEIHADSGTSDRKEWNVYGSAERNVVTAVRFPLERHHRRASGRWQRLRKLYRSQFRQTQDAARPLCFANVLKAQRATHLARLESRVSRPLAGLNAPEEVGERRVLIAQTLGKARRRNTGEPGELLNRFEPSELARNGYAGERFFAPSIGFRPHIQRPVPDPTGSAEPLVQYPSLCAIGVGADAVRPHGCRHAENYNRAEEQIP